MQRLLGYQVLQANCCRILSHPQWGAAVYPASMLFVARLYDGDDLLAGERCVPNVLKLRTVVTSFLEAFLIK
jgi:hypothetical protein